MLDNISYETDLWEKGYKIIAGCDEVGRGAIAGPIVTAAVSWDEKTLEDLIRNKIPEIFIINDSKKLTERKRIQLNEFIIKKASSFSIVEFDNNEIDKYGVGEVNKKALAKALLNIKNLEHALVDHFKIKINVPILPITKGDEKSISIASASIIAKVHRDNLMKTKFHELFPMYGFDRNVGYGTKYHLDAIRQYGLSPIHRMSYNLVL